MLWKFSTTRKTAPYSFADSGMVADDVGLVIGPVTIRDIFAIIAAGDFPLPSLDLADQHGIIQDYVANELVIVLPGSPVDVLYSTLCVGAVIRGIQGHRRMVVGHWFSLKGCNGRRLEYFFRRPQHSYDWSLFLFHADFPGQILLLAGPANRDAMADQESLWGFRHVRRKPGPVECFQVASPPKMGIKKPGLSLRLRYVYFFGYKNAAPLGTAVAFIQISI